MCVCIFVVPLAREIPLLFFSFSLFLISLALLGGCGGLNLRRLRGPNRGPGRRPCREIHGAKPGEGGMEGEREERERRERERQEREKQYIPPHTVPRRGCQK